MAISSVWGKLQNQQISRILKGTLTFAGDFLQTAEKVAVSPTQYFFHLATANYSSAIAPKKASMFKGVNVVIATL